MSVVTYKFRSLRGTNLILKEDLLIMSHIKIVTVEETSFKETFFPWDLNA